MVAAIIPGAQAEAAVADRPADQVFPEFIESEMHTTLQVQLLAAEEQVPPCLQP